MNVLPILMFCVLLAAAVWHDVRSRRIPNRLVFIGAALALALQTLLPGGDGFFNVNGGALGLLASLEGLGLGLVFLLPMYMLRAMGAGDVKLMAMVGAFVGPQLIIGATIATLIAGGVLAISVALANGSLRKMMRNSYHMAMHSLLGSLGGDIVRIEAPTAASGKLPYAIAIATGTLAWLALGSAGIGAGL
jgi:prepilin peptidase CpaA